MNFLFPNQVHQQHQKYDQKLQRKEMNKLVPSRRLEEYNTSASHVGHVDIQSIQQLFEAAQQVKVALCVASSFFFPSGSHLCARTGELREKER